MSAALRPMGSGRALTLAGQVACDGVLMPALCEANRDWSRFARDNFIFEARWRLGQHRSSFLFRYQLAHRQPGQLGSRCQLLRAALHFTDPLALAAHAGRERRMEALFPKATPT